MTVPADYQPDVSTGNGVTTAFPYTFRILNAADLLVQVDGVTATGYTVDGVGDAGGGNVTFAAAPANGAVVVRARNMAYSRSTDYQEGGGFQADTVNDDFDRPVMLLQQVNDQVRRSIALPLDSAIRDLVIPSPEAGKVLLWNADADALQNGPTADEITSAQGYATDASAFASAASGSASDAADSAAAAATSLVAAGLPNPIIASALLKAKADGTGYEAITVAQLMDDVGIMVGDIRTVRTDYAGAAEPPSSHYIRLKSGLTGAGQYNAGKLTTESVSGSSPLINATAVISDPTSPMNGVTIHLDEDEGRFYRAGSPGTLQDSQNLLHTHSGALNTNVGFTPGGSSYYVASNNAQQTGPSGGTEARPRNVGVAVYMRYK